MLSGSCPIAMSPPTEKYDVFLSFRGEDTRDNFISHLSAELYRKNIKTFIDYRLDRGKEISPALYTEIEQSMIYVIILSENYASSTWCMDELTKILECKQIYGRDVIPVFYKVDPSNVRNQRESFEEAFIEHQQRFGDKVDTWKGALTQVAGLSGWDSQVTRSLINLRALNIYLCVRVSTIQNSFYQIFLIIKFTVRSNVTIK
jgi:hypothetical protein